MDKLQDILDGEVEKVALKIVHGAKLPSGKRTAAPGAPPISINNEPYKDPVEFTSTLKVSVLL